MPPRQDSFAGTVSDLTVLYLAAFPRTPTKGQQSLSDRIRRALSWMNRAAAVSHEDRPPRYVDLWIALNALYGQRYYGIGSETKGKDYKDFQEFVHSLAQINRAGAELKRWIGKRHVQGRIRHLVENQFLYVEYWEGKTDALAGAIKHQSEGLERAFRNHQAGQALELLFNRLIALRNQIVHGSASADTRRNKDALVPGILILEELLPLLVTLLIEHGRGRPWPDVPYPGIRTPLHTPPR
ncbi:MAG: HEPN domain-containing protein [Nitrospira sp.]|nr:HEPN domain-containing protein [Nitrospira sp.]